MHVLIEKREIRMITWLMILLTSAHASTKAYFEDIENFTNKNLNLKSEVQTQRSREDSLLSRKLFWTPKIGVSAYQSQTQLNNANSKNDAVQADLTLNLYRGGSDYNYLQSAKALLKHQELQVVNETLKLQVTASDLVFKNLYLKESAELQEKILKLKEESLKITQDRYRQGKTPQQEVTKAEVDISQQRSRLRLANLEVIENQSQIKAYFVEEIKTKIWPFSEKIMAKNSDKLQKTPLVEQKYWFSQAQEQIWKSAKASHWPSLDLSLQYKEYPFNERSNRETVGALTLTIPLWSQYETEAKISSAYAEYFAAMNDFKITEKSVIEKNNLLKEKLDVLRQNLVDAKKNLQISRKLYQDMLKSFKLGRLSSNDLFIEQNRLLENENSFSSSQLSFHQSIVEACALAGLSVQVCVY